jgi:uncharacterized phage protein gp47/JayE
MEPPGGKRTYEEIVAELLERLQTGGVITDVNPGSVARTLVEAFSLEMALAYARLAYIYEAGFLETATAEALDSVVALLGIRRIAGKQCTGDAVFSRDLRVRDRIEIPEGTELLITQKASKKQVTYRTLARAALDVDQKKVTVPIAVDIPPGAKDADYVLTADDLGEAKQVTTLAGIAAVEIARPTAVRDRKETDDELRERARTLAASAGGGTFRAIKRAVLATGFAKSITFRDKNTAPDDFQPGELEVAVDADLSDDDVAQSIRDAINATKGPGIYVRLRGVDRKLIWMEITVQPVSSLTRDRRQSLRRELEQTIQSAFAALNPGEKLLWNPLQAKLLGVNGVLDLSEVAVAWDGLPQPKAPGREIPEFTLSTLDRVVPPPGWPSAVVRFDDETGVGVSVKVTGTAAQTVRDAVAVAIEGLLTAANDADTEQKRRLTLADFTKAVGGTPGVTVAAVRIREDGQGGEKVLATPDDYYILRQGYRLYLDRQSPEWGAGPS